VKLRSRVQTPVAAKRAFRWGLSGLKKLAIFWPGFENSGNGFVGAAQIVSRLYK